MNRTDRDALEAQPEQSNIPPEPAAAASAGPDSAGGSAGSTRRDFLKLAALGSVAALVPASAERVSAATRRAARKAAKAHKAAAAAAPAVDGEHPNAAALAAEIAKQKKSTADLLKTIRGYELAPGSEQAFVFEPVSPGVTEAAPAAAREGTR